MMDIHLDFSAWSRPCSRLTASWPEPFPGRHLVIPRRGNIDNSIDITYLVTPVVNIDNRVDAEQTAKGWGDKKSWRVDSACLGRTGSRCRL